VKVNRRSFFGVAAAAPVAAKQAVTSVLEYDKATGTGLLSKVSGFYGGVPEKCPDATAPSSTYWQDELRYALQQRRSIKESTPVRHHALDLAAFVQIDNRRATSPAVKALLIAEERAKREKARELSYIDERIAELKEKLGPLAMIFDGGE